MRERVEGKGERGRVKGEERVLGEERVEGVKGEERVGERRE